MSKKCILEINDFVNMKMIGLDPNTRRKCVDKLKFFVPYARNVPSFKMGRWDGKVSFCTVGGGTYINLLPDLFETIVKSGYEIEVNDNRPFQPEDLKFDPIDEEYFSDILWPDGTENEGEPIILMDHQVEAINALLENSNGILNAATGSGKTIITAALSKKVENYGRSIIIVPNKSLVNQTEKTYKMLGLDVGVFYGDRKELNKTHTVCTWQSLDRVHKKSKSQLTDLEIDEFLNGVVCFINDECHGATGKSLVDLHSQAFKNIPLRWGLTGTVPKDKHLYTSLRATIGEVVHTIKAKKLQDINVLSNCDITINQFRVDIDFKDYFKEKEFKKNNKDILSELSELIKEDALVGNTLVLVENIDTGIELERLVNNSIFLSGSNKTKERESYYNALSSRNNCVIIATYGIASVGIDINRLFNVILYDPGKSFTRVIQSIGRGLRIAKDKNYVRIRDVCFNTKYSSRHLSERKKFYKESEYPFNIIKKTIKLSKGL